MTRKLLGIFTSITAALMVVSVAWAAGDAGRQGGGAPAGVIAGEVSLAGSAATSVTEGTLPSSSSTSVTTGAGSSTSVTTTGSSSTSTTTPGPDSTSTTIRAEMTTSTGGTFQVADAGKVTVDVRAGVLVLVDVSAPGWEIRIKDVRHDRVRIELRKGEDKAEFEAELEDGRLEIEIKRS